MRWCSRQAAWHCLQVPEQAVGALVAVFGRFGEELHDDVGQRFGNGGVDLERRRRPDGEMAVDQLHGVGGGERRPPGEGLVERGAEGVEVGAVIDRPVHPPGLLGGEVGEGPFQAIGGAGVPMHAGQAGGDPEVGDLDRRERVVDHDVGRVEVLVDDVGVVEMPQRPHEGDRHAEEGLGVESRRADHRPQRTAAAVFEDQPDPVLEPLDPQGPDDAVEMQVLDDAVLVGEAGHFLGGRVLALQQLDDDRRRRALGAGAQQDRGGGLAQHLDLFITLEFDHSLSPVSHRSSPRERRGCRW